MLKYDIQPQFECQNRILNANCDIWPSSNVKIGFLMSKFDIQPYFECQNRIFNVKIRYSVPVRMSKWDFECRNMYSARF